MDFNRLCRGCFREMPQAGTKCPFCGFNELQYEQQRKPEVLPVNTILRGAYLVGQCIGKGGFGITYIGWHLNLDIPVAIKEFFPAGVVSRDTNRADSAQSMSVALTDSGFAQPYQKALDSFIKEAKTLASLSFPGVVRVYDCFEENRTAYIVMDYIQGQDLSLYLKKSGGRLEEAQALSLIRPVVQSLEQLHGKGIIHRDISPDNLLMGPDGKMTLVDFGAARAISSDFEGDSAVRSMTVVLKPGYAPMEQYNSHGDQGPWTDVYALCATLYRMLTGKKPEDPGTRSNRPDDEQVIRKKLKENHVSDRTVDVLVKGLQLLIKDRYQSMKELEAGLYPEIGKTVPGRQSSVTLHQAAPSRKLPPSSSSSGNKKKTFGIVIPIAALLMVAVIAGGFIILKNTVWKPDQRREQEATESGAQVETQKISETETQKMPETETQKVSELSVETETETETQKSSEKEIQESNGAGFEEMTENPETSEISKEIQEVIGSGESKAWLLTAQSRTMASQNAQNTSTAPQLGRLFVLGAMYNCLNRGACGETDEDGNILSVYGTILDLEDLPYHVLERMNQGRSSGCLSFENSSAATDNLICRMGHREEEYEELNLSLGWDDMDKVKARPKGLKAVRAFAADHFREFDLKEVNSDDVDSIVKYAYKETLEDCVAFMTALGEPVIDEETALWGAGHRSSLINVLAAPAVDGIKQSTFLERMLSLQNAGNGTGTLCWVENCMENGFETVILYVQEEKASSAFGILSPKDTGTEWAEKLADLIWKEMTGQDPAEVQGQWSEGETQKDTENNSRTAMREVKPGDHITFGHYEQDNNLKNGKEEIEWIVLDRKENQLLVISKYGLDAKAYHTESTDVTWETCDLRGWLNDTFYQEAFSEEERQQIEKTNVINEDNKYWGTDAGTDTTDNVFLLHIAEAEDLFADNDARICYPTAHAKAHGAWASDTTGSCWWLLRSPGFSNSLAACVFSDGAVSSIGGNVERNGGCVRPSLWISLDKNGKE